MDAPRVLGLDLSLTSTGAAVLAGQHLLRAANFRTAPGDGCDTVRADYIATCIVALLDDFPVDCIAIENYAHSRPTNQNRLGELGGVVKLRLWEAGYDPDAIVLVAPSSAKLFATGSGRASKADMMAAAAPWLAGHRFEKVNDVADAVHIARYALASIA